jgi:tetratricopeptide (TPR) repeat protein
MRRGQLILSELAEIVASIYESLEQSFPQAAIEATAALANFVDFTGFGDTTLLSDAARVAEEHQLPDLAAELWERLGDIAFVRGDTVQARDFFQRALTRFSHSPNTVKHAKCAKRLADIAVERGDSRMALLLYAEAEALYEQAHHDVGTARCLRGKAVLALREGKLKKAAALCREALVRFRRQGDLLGQANAEKTAGLVALLRGQVEPATVKLKSALEQFTLLGDTLGVAESTRYLGSIAAANGDFSEAMQLLSQAHQYFEALARVFEMRETQLALLLILEPRQRLAPEHANLRSDLEDYFNTHDTIASHGCKLLLDALRPGMALDAAALARAADFWRAHRRCDLLLTLTGLTGTLSP